MKIAVIGTGYVGLVTGACFAEIGHSVTCADIDQAKIAKLQDGIIPIYEPGLKEIVDRNVQGKRLKFTTEVDQAINLAEVVFSAVGTPPGKDGQVDLKYVFSVADVFAKNLHGFKILVDKSTVPVGTAEKLTQRIKQKQADKKASFELVSNPEFLKEGAAIQDSLNPDRIVVGVSSERARKIMEQLYHPFIRAGRPIVFTDIKSAELIKYAANAMLATRISFMNEIANFADLVGADVKEVSRGIGLDKRIGPRFLQAGIGYGGSCFPKDVIGLIDSGKKSGYQFKILQAVEAVNKNQKFIVIEKLKKFLKSLKDKKIAILGLSFKPKTDDMREAPSLEIIKKLIQLGAKIQVFDPVAMENAKKELPKKNIDYFQDVYETAKGTDALLVLTEWDEFRGIDFKKLKKIMRNKIIIDGRNIFEREEVEAEGFKYAGVGR